MSVKKPPSVRPPPKPANLKFVRAQFAFAATEPDELSFSEVSSLDKGRVCAC